MIVAGGGAPFFDRLEIDLNAPAVAGLIGAVHADERREAFDRRVLKDYFAKLLLALRHGREGHRLRRFRDPQDDSGILNREKSLGNNLEQQEGRAQRGYGDK